MKQGLIILIALLLMCGTNAQVKKAGAAGKYEVVANFTSICCGTASDDFLKNFVKAYNKKNKQGVVPYRISACGREGEFRILVSLSKLSKANKAKFITSLKKLVFVQNKNIEAAGQNKGLVNLSYDQSDEAVQGCRGTIEKWELK